MAGNAGLAADRTVRTHLGRSGDAAQGRHHGIVPHFDIVGHLAEVVDLDALAHDGRAHCGAVDRRVGADLHIVFEHHVAQLGNLAIAAVFLRSEAEAVGADHHSGVQDASVPDHAVVADAHARIEDTVLPYFHAGAQIDLRVDICTLPYLCGKGDGATQGKPGTEPVTTLARSAHPVEEVEQDGYRRIGVVHPDERGGYRFFGFERLVDQQDAGFRIVDVMLVFGIGQETDISPPGLLDAGRARDHGRGVAHNLAAEKVCQGLRAYFHTVLQK